MKIEKEVVETKTFTFSFKTNPGTPDERSYTFAINADTKAEACSKLARELQEIADHVKNDPTARSQ